MPDLRESLGIEVEPDVKGPYSTQPAKRDGTGNDGGILDVGIIAYLANGKRVVIGEIWAACPDEDGGKTRINASTVAERIVSELNQRRSTAVPQADGDDGNGD